MQNVTTERCQIKKKSLSQMMRYLALLPCILTWRPAVKNVCKKTRGTSLRERRSEIGFSTDTIILIMRDGRFDVLA